MSGSATMFWMAHNAYIYNSPTELLIAAFENVKEIEGTTHIYCNPPCFVNMWGRHAMDLFHAGKPIGPEIKIVHYSKEGGSTPLCQRDAEEGDVTTSNKEEVTCSKCLGRSSFCDCVRVEGMDVQYSFQQTTTREWACWNCGARYQPIEKTRDEIYDLKKQIYALKEKLSKVQETTNQVDN